jgi:hypothetical protein
VLLRGKRSSVGGNKLGLGDCAFPDVGSHTAANNDSRATIKTGASSQGTSDMLFATSREADEQAGRRAQHRCERCFRDC